MIMLCFASCSSCKKDVAPVDQLPPETQTGANTAGALINGVAWMPTGKSGVPATRPINGGYFGPYINVPKYSVWLRMYKDDRTSMELFVQSVDKPGRYPLSFDTTNDIGGTPNSKSFGFYVINGKMLNDPDYNYITTSTKTGYVNFTKVDTTNQLLAGTFEFDAIDNPSGKTIKITGGRFDINQKTLNP